MKKLMSLLLSVCMLLSVTAGMTFTAKAADYSGVAIKASELVGGDTFQFGMYPQSRVTDSATVSALAAINCTMKSYGYKASDGNVDMSYADIRYNGEFYRKVTINQNRPTRTNDSLNADTVTVQEANGYASGRTYYFKWEPISWRVISKDSSSVYAMADVFLDAQVYYESNANYIKSWKTSTIRTWLNDNFYNAAFSDTEKNAIKTTFLSDYVEDTTTGDNLYLPSYFDAKSFFDSVRRANGTDYAKSQGAPEAWWTLSTDAAKEAEESYGTGMAIELNRYVYAVDSTGVLKKLEFFYTEGVRPAFRLDVNAEVGKADAAACRIAGEHTWDDGIETKAATCTEKGKKTYTCIYCGATKTEEIAVLGHDWVSKNDNTYHWVECNNCGETKDKYEHSWDRGTIIKSATCAEYGEKTYKCTACDATQSEQLDKVIDHKYNATVTKQPTCNEFGEIEYKCADCGKSYNEELPKTDNHKYTETVKVPATCSADGVMLHKCDICQKEYTTVITAKGHNYVAEVKEPTCTEEGYTTYICDVCGETRKKDGEVYKTNITKPVSHVFNTVTTTPPTCNTNGEKKSVCTNCGYEQTEIIPATGNHKYNATVTKQPTCNEFGEIEYKCADCGKSYNEELPKTDNHKYTETVKVPATCSADGVMLHKCDICQKEYTTIIPATGHQFIVTEHKAANCKEGGYQTYKCINPGCNEGYNGDYTPAKGHNYVAEVKEPTCTEEGYTTYICDVCSETRKKDGEVYKTNITKPISHIFNTVTTTPPTCNTNGEKKSVCTNCGYEQTEIIPATGNHKYSAVITTEATCSSKGIVTYTCENCASSYTEETPALGHDWKADWSKNKNYHWHACTRCKDTLDKAEHTYGKSGDARFTCKICGYVDKNKKEEAKAADKAASEKAYAGFVAGLKGTTDGKTVTVKWGKIKGADRYVIYATYCGQDTFKKLRTVKGGTTSYGIMAPDGKKLNSRKNLKVYIIAQKKVDGRYIELYESPVIHIAGKNSKYTNIKKINVKKNSFALKVNKTAKIKPSSIFENKNKKPIDHVAKYRYISSNTAVAAVDKNGKIKALGKGTAKIYVYGANGVSKAVKVIVK